MLNKLCLNQRLFGLHIMWDLLGSNIGTRSYISRYIYIVFLTFTHNAADTTPVGDLLCKNGDGIITQCYN